MKAETLFNLSDYEPEDQQYGWDDFVSTLSATSGYVLITGYFMSWMGPQHGGKICKSLRAAAVDIVMDESTPIFSINKEGMMVLDETHHDAPCAGNHYEFKILTKIGTKWYEEHKDDYDRKTLCETLKNTKGYSRKVRATDFNY